MKIRNFLILSISILFLAACASGPSAYKKPRKKKKKKCDCPSWSFQKSTFNKTNDFLYV